MDLQRDDIRLITPEPAPPQSCATAREAVDALRALYDEATTFLRERFEAVMAGAPVEGRYRAYYPEIRLQTTSHTVLDSRLAFGYVPGPGTFSTTVTRPDLFDRYLEEQIDLLIENHGGGVYVGQSQTPIPLHFAFAEGAHVDGAIADRLDRPMRDVFDAPDLSATDDKIVNSRLEADADDMLPLAPFTAQRIDYSLHRLSHYTATSPAHFQNFVLFTNYQFYVDEFVEFAQRAVADPDSGYDSFIEPGNRRTDADGVTGEAPARLPQMPAYHLTRKDDAGITMVNIGVGPSNAKTITDHVAVLRPHTWLMLGHCAGLRNSQRLGDYVLAHAYLREDHVLDGRGAGGAGTGRCRRDRLYRL